MIPLEHEYFGQEFKECKNPGPTLVLTRRKYAQKCNEIHFMMKKKVKVDNWVKILEF